MSQHLASRQGQAGVTTPEPGDGASVTASTPEPASKHLASDRGEWETQRLGDTEGDTTLEPPSRHLASDRRDWETGRQAENKTRNPRHTFPFSIPQVRTPMLRCLGKKAEREAQKPRTFVTSLDCPYPLRQARRTARSARRRCRRCGACPRGAAFATCVKVETRPLGFFSQNSSFLVACPLEPPTKGSTTTSRNVHVS